MGFPYQAVRASHVDVMAVSCAWAPKYQIPDIVLHDTEKTRDRTVPYSGGKETNTVDCANTKKSIYRTRVTNVPNMVGLPT